MAATMRIHGGMGGDVPAGTIILFYPYAGRQPAHGRMNLPMLSQRGSSDNKKTFHRLERTERKELMDYSIQLNAVNNPEKNVRAFATVVFGDCFKVTNVAVIEGSKGTFVSMPSFRTKERDEYNNPVYKDVCNPVTKEFREELYGDILKLYGEMEQTGKAEVKMEADSPNEPAFTVRVTPFEREGSNMVGLASIVLNDSFAVSNVGVVQGKNGIFVAMPSYKAGNKYRDVCFPVTKEFREKVNNAVLETFHQAKEKAAQEGQERASRQFETDDRGYLKASGEPLPFR